MTDAPAVTAVVPNYNHARFLPKRIDSILGQTFQDFELILLDDCSTDESRMILSKYASTPRVRIELNERNSGTPFKQWNKGVRMARGKYIWIAESDDYADERLLERLVRELETDEKITYAYCRSWRVTENDHVEGFVEPYLDPPDVRRWSSDFCSDGVEECRRYLVRTNPSANASAVVFRKAVFENVGGADESLKICGDWKLWAAMALRGKVAYVSEPLNHYRFHPKSVRSTTEDTGLGVAEVLRVVRWIIGNVEPADSVLERFCDVAGQTWVPAVMSARVPLQRKWEILRDIKAVDRHPIKRAARIMAMMARQKTGARWHGIRDRIKEAYAHR